MLTAYDFTQPHNEDSVKILAYAKIDEVLGVHMIGARCADLIAEAIKEAALAATGDRVLHV